MWSNANNLIKVLNLPRICRNGEIAEWKNRVKLLHEAVQCHRVFYLWYYSFRNPLPWQNGTGTMNEPPVYSFVFLVVVIFRMNRRTCVNLWTPSQCARLWMTPRCCANPRDGPARQFRTPSTPPCTPWGRSTKRFTSKLTRSPTTTTRLNATRMAYRSRHKVNEGICREDDIFPHSHRNTQENSSYRSIAVSLRCLRPC